MSLYFDAVAILTAPSTGGSFKSRIYSARNLRASPAQIYALTTEAAKWDTVLAEVIDKSGILALERKLSPLLALLLVHDHLLAKKGIAAPATHTLRQTVERHKARLRAEFTKARVCRGCASVEQFKAVVIREKRLADGTSHFVYPRWVRINNIRTTLEEQLSTTFKSYRRVDSLAELAPEDELESQKPEPRLFIDPNIPDLVAVPFGADFTASSAYKNGEIILQDKASCFPAYLLLGDRGPSDPWEGDLVDGCAAPGNKTTHLASLMAKQHKNSPNKKQRIFSMDASTMRSKTLQKMVGLAGADSVTVLQGQDFLALDPEDERFENVTGLLLDPSCSGSGIIGRDDVPQFTLPTPAPSKAPKSHGKKRKRPDNEDEADGEQSKATPGVPQAAPTDENDIPDGTIDPERLAKLSSIQARIVEHALSFPNATHVTYSTCSIHLIENEGVVARILRSRVAQEHGWRLMRRDEQPDGLRRWSKRGVREERPAEGDTGPSGTVDLPDEALEACIRSWQGDAEGLGGFFVAGFIRDPDHAVPLLPAKERESQNETDKHNKSDKGEDGEEDEDEEWGGFSD
ncbi:Bacterial Fmu (Sun)/eukaryotic nucleolar NOL1/Nop2p [Penicillium paradoxum]|uniref:Bacterial Fmu (Sun)/eukaryotic nucleolar NOL1/Nop2p n=1 Tax=Penicillium paradoxum TaxID=176176 RepID=UPI0025493CC2|nr:Bacterial Fmu (Sun)/eukaryotic nucleolar NOL1/Nop2p [Penicillium paradoxum]KAJ5779922.1 Bacterial Fmu (Sun)/eukaryotic nucleolar NOL1/Nop2p [Penicillium paradoxum]